MMWGPCEHSQGCWWNLPGAQGQAASPAHPAICSCLITSALCLFFGGMSDGAGGGEQ